MELVNSYLFGFMTEAMWVNAAARGKEREGRKGLGGLIPVSLGSG